MLAPVTQQGRCSDLSSFCAPPGPDRYFQRGRNSHMKFIMFRRQFSAIRGIPSGVSPPRLSRAKHFHQPPRRPWAPGQSLLLSPPSLQHLATWAVRIHGITRRVTSRVCLLSFTQGNVFKVQPRRMVQYVFLWLKNAHESSLTGVAQQLRPT